MTLLVVGCGSIGWRHLTNLRVLNAGDLIACEADEETARRVEAHFGVRVYRRPEDALVAAPQAVLVCTPTHQHVAVARLAILAGAHVFIEKPLAASLDGVPELLGSLEGRGVVSLVGCNMRFHPGVSHLKALVDSGELGAPLLVRSWFGHYLPNWRPGRDYRTTYSAVAAQGGGVILEGIHEVDYAQWLAGEIRTIGAHGGRVSALNIDGEDTALLALSFAGGARGEIHLDYLRPVKARGCEVVGTEGLARWTSDGKNPEVVRVEAWDRTGQGHRIVYQSDGYDANLMYLAEMKHFLDCVAGTDTPQVGVRDAARVLALVLDARRAMADAAGAGAP